MQLQSMLWLVEPGGTGNAPIGQLNMIFNSSGWWQFGACEARVDRGQVSVRLAGAKVDKRDEPRPR